MRVIDLDRVDEITKDLLSRKEQDGGLSISCLKLMKRLMENYSLMSKYTQTETNRFLNGGYVKCKTLDIGCAYIIVCQKQRKCTITEIRKK